MPLKEEGGAGVGKEGHAATRKLQVASPALDCASERREHGLGSYTQHSLAEVVMGLGF